MPVTVKTFATSGEAATALSSEHDARYLGGGTLVMRALNEGDLSFSTVVRATDRALTQLDFASDGHEPSLSSGGKPLPRKDIASGWYYSLTIATVSLAINKL